MLARSYRMSGNAGDAEAQMKEARRALDEIRQEAGTDSVLARDDLGPTSSKSTAQ